MAYTSSAASGSDSSDLINVEHGIFIYLISLIIRPSRFWFKLFQNAD